MESVNKTLREQGDVYNRDGYEGDVQHTTRTGDGIQVNITDNIERLSFQDERNDERHEARGPSKYMQYDR